MTKNISKNIIDQIKDKNIKPKAKWKFLLKDSVLIFSFISSVIIGGLAMSVIIFMLVSNDWELYKHLNHNSLKFLFKTLPYIWIAIFLAFMFVSYYNLKHTKQGYKYKLSIFILSNILISLLLGFAFFGMGIAKKIEKQALQKIPKYKELTYDEKVKLWDNNDEGILAGEILSIENNKEIIIKDIKENKWTVKLPKELKKLGPGDRIGLFGEKTDNNNFTAKKVRPWNGNFHERK
jgi:hypothetical protein